MSDKTTMAQATNPVKGTTTVRDTTAVAHKGNVNATKGKDKSSKPSQKEKNNIKMPKPNGKEKKTLDQNGTSKTKEPQVTSTKLSAATKAKEKMSKKIQLPTAGVDLIARVRKAPSYLSAVGILEMFRNLRYYHDDSVRAAFTVLASEVSQGEDADVVCLLIRTWDAIVSVTNDAILALFRYWIMRIGLKDMMIQGKVAYDVTFKGEEGKISPFYDWLIQSWHVVKDITTIMLFPSRFSIRNSNDDAINEFRKIQHLLGQWTNGFDYVKPYGYPRDWGTIEFTKYDVYFDSDGNRCERPIEWKIVLYKQRLDKRILPRFKHHNAFINGLFTSTADALYTTSAYKKLPELVFAELLHNPVQISSGANADTNRLIDKMDKVNALNRYIDYLTSHGMKIQQVVKVCDLTSEQMKVMTVPKNMESSRVIAPASVLSAAFGRVLQKEHMRLQRRAFYELSNGRVCICQQEQWVNRDYAQIGSVTQEYATIDLTHASDYVSAELVRTATRKMPMIFEFCPGYVRYPDGSVEQSETFAAAGYSDTFNNECDIFGIIAEMACVLVYDLAKVEPTYSQRYACVIVGDDIVCAKELYDTIVQLLEYFGFIVNHKKSFSEGDFRESCGGDYFRGEDISPVYWPRKTWSMTSGKLNATDFTSEKPDEQTSTLVSAISLARRLYHYPLAQAIVTEFILNHTGKDVKFTMSNDIEEIGIKTQYHTLERYYTTPYCEVKEEVKTVHGIQTTERKVQSWKMVTKDEDVKQRRYIAPKLRSAYAVEYEKFKKNQPYDNTLLTKKAISVIEEYLYTQFLAHGPRYSEPLLKTLKVSDRLGL